MANINVTKLTQELTNAGIQCSGCNSDGIVWDVDGTTEIQNRPDVQAIILVHDPDTPSWDDIRKQRDRLLYECDWTQLVDTQLSENEIELWASYRQLLRDIPQMYEKPEDVVFPPKPG